MGEMEEKRVENVDGEPRLATLGRECTHISHNFPRKFPGKLRAGIVQLKFIFEHPGSGFHICVRNSFRFSLSLSFTSLVPLALFLFRSCPPFLLSPTSSAATWKVNSAVSPSFFIGTRFLSLFLSLRRQPGNKRSESTDRSGYPTKASFFFFFSKERSWFF